MSFILSVPALIKILLVFVIIIFLNRFIPLYLAIYIGALLIGFWMKIGLSNIIYIIFKESTAHQTLWLSLIIVLILIFSDLLKRSKELDAIVSSFELISPSPRFTLAAMPALIGFLPMPGGALFSAPMVESATGKNETEPELKVAINYWFRHIWEYWWPLYPGVILAISLVQVKAWKFMIVQMPLSIGAVTTGIIFILSKIEVHNSNQNREIRNVREFIWNILPILTVIATILCLELFLWVLTMLLNISIRWPDYLNVVIGISLGIVIVIKRNSLSIENIRAAFLNKSIISMVMIIFAIISFKGILIESKAIDQVRAELSAYHIPIIVIVAFLPFVAGFVTGIALGFVGTAFPVVVSLVHNTGHELAYAVLAFGFGYMGMMLTPLHLCFLVTREYFHVDLFHSYHHIWRPASAMLLWTILLFLIYMIII